MPSSKRSSSPNATAARSAKRHCAQQARITVRRSTDRARPPPDSDGDDSEQELDDDEDSEDEELDGEFDWLEEIRASAFVEGCEDKVATCDAKLISRDEIEDAFLQEMDEPSRETAEFSSELFDNQGQLRRKYYEHEIIKGSGVWGPELGIGDILLIEDLHVHSDWRGIGLGTKIVKEVLDNVRNTTDEFIAFVWPAALSIEMDDDLEGKEGERFELREKLVTGATAFWRSLGFRRVGTSRWLAWTDDSSHPARNLSIEDDWDEPPARGNEVQGPMDPRAHFLMRSLGSSTDEECIREFEAEYSKDTEWDVSSRLSLDDDGNTFLHHAASCAKPKALKEILSRWPHLAKQRNFQGLTPLQALQDDMEDTAFSLFMGRSSRHDPGAVQCLTTLMAHA